MKVLKLIFAHFEEAVSCVVMLVMLALTFMNVVMRNFAASISFTEEITTSLFVLLCMMGTAIAARERSHLGLSFLTELMPKKMQKTLAIVANILGVVFSLILLRTGFDMVLNEYQLQQISIAIQWPQWIYGSFLPIGALCMAVRFAEAAVYDARDLKQIKEEEGK